MIAPEELTRLKKQLVDKITAGDSAEPRRMSLTFRRSAGSQKSDLKTACVQCIINSQDIAEIYQQLSTFLEELSPQEKQLSQCLVNMLASLKQKYPDDFAVQSPARRRAGLDDLPDHEEESVSGMTTEVPFDFDAAMNQQQSDAAVLSPSNVQPESTSLPTSPPRRFFSNPAGASPKRTLSRQVLSTIGETRPVRPIMSSAGELPFKASSEGVGVTSQLSGRGAPRRRVESRAEQTQYFQAAQEAGLAQKRMEKFAAEMLEYSAPLLVDENQVRVSVGRVMNEWRAKKGLSLLEGHPSLADVKTFFKEQNIPECIANYLCKYFHTEHGVMDILHAVEMELRLEGVVLNSTDTKHQFLTQPLKQDNSSSEVATTVKVVCEMTYGGTCVFNGEDFAFEGSPTLESRVNLLWNGKEVQLKDLQYYLYRGEGIKPTAARQIFEDFFNAQREYQVLRELRDYHQRSAKNQQGIATAMEGLALFGGGKAKKPAENKEPLKKSRWLSFRRPR